MSSRLCPAFLVLAIAGLPQSGLAQSAQPAQPTSQRSSTTSDPVQFRLGNDDVFIELSPFLQMDGSFASSSPDSLIPSDEESDGDIRRARLYFDFGYYDFGGQFTVDFAAAPERPYTYAFVNYAVTDALTLQVGQQDVPFSLQDQIGSRSALFNESSDSSTLQTPDLVGAVALYGVDNFSLSGGVFGGDLNDRPFDDGTTVAARATYAPILTDDSVLHFGIAGRGSFDTRTPFSFSSGTGSSLVSASPVATGGFEDTSSYTAANFELAATSGRLTYQSEYTVGNVDGGRIGGRPRPDAFLHGGYASLLTFLTDDHRSYSGSSGTFDRVEPARPVDQGGFGAVEIGARFDYLDLSDADEDLGSAIGNGAGRQLGGTAIANWYLTEQYRLSASNTFTHVASGDREGDDYNTTLLRLWFVY